MATTPWEVLQKVLLRTLVLMLIDALRSRGVDIPAVRAADMDKLTVAELRTVKHDMESVMRSIGGSREA